MTDTVHRRPTRGQQRILQLCCRVTYVLWAEDARTNAQVRNVHYYIIERGTRLMVQQVVTRMVNALLEAGWIEHVPGGNANEWTYRVTEAGIAAANGPTRGE